MNINTNISAINTREFLRRNQDFMETSMERLSSGRRINNAGDDAAGLAISEKMSSQIRGLDVGIRNSSDGISLTQTAESALGSISTIVQRMRELAVQAANGTYSAADRVNLDAEFQQLLQEVDNIAYGTSFNGVKLTAVGPKVPVYTGAFAGPAVTANEGTHKVTGAAAGQEWRVFDKDGNDVSATFTGTTGAWKADATTLTLDNANDYVVWVRTIDADGGAVGNQPSDITVLEFAKDDVSIKRTIDLQVSNRQGDLVRVDLEAVSSRSLGLTTANGVSIDILTDANAQLSMASLDGVLDRLSTARANLGAMQNRLSFTVDNSSTSKSNIEAARSRVLDSDMSKEMSELTKQRVLIQSSIAMLQQANQNPQMVLQLLQNN